MSDAVSPRPPFRVVVRDSARRGRGVFTLSPIRAGELIERAPVIVVPRTDLALMKGKLLDDYWFLWGEHEGAFALGWASLYNHRCPSNATFHCEFATRTIAITAVRDIPVDTEITINYHGEPDDPDPLWFPLA